MGQDLSTKELVTDQERVKLETVLGENGGDKDQKRWRGWKTTDKRRAKSISLKKTGLHEIAMTGNA